MHAVLPENEAECSEGEELGIARAQLTSNVKGEGAPGLELEWGILGRACLHRRPAACGSY